MTAMRSRTIQIGALVTLVTLAGGAWQPAVATHFRYAHLSWVQTGATSVAFTVQAAFRRSASPSFDECVDPASGSVIPCSGAGGLADVGDVIREDIGDTRLVFGDGTEAYVSNPSNPSEHYLYFVVTSIDPDDNWLLGIALDPAGLPAIDTDIDHTYASTGPWAARIDTCCRIEAAVAPNAHINNPEGEYRIEARVDLSAANDSPVSSLPPIVLCPENGTCQFQILASDPDGDPVHFRLSTAAEAAGDAVFRQPGPPDAPNAATISPSGLYTWNTTGATLGAAGSNTLYSTQVSIEDLDASNSAKSKVAVDFFIQLVPQVNHAPTFSQPACGSTLSVDTGSLLQFPIAASDQDVGDTVTLNASGVPAGVTLTPSLPTEGNPVSSQFTWTPALADAGNHVVTFSATDQASQQALCAVTIQVTSTCGNGTTDPGENCDGGECCTLGCRFATWECRASTGECDPAETCSGAAASCPADVLAAPGAPCGDAGTQCTNQDTCDGSGTCVDNGFKANGAPCGSAQANACNGADTCNGGGVCETHVAPAGTPCGDAGTDCTNQDRCDDSGSCIDNGVQPAGTPCSADGNLCTDDVCDTTGGCGVPNSATCDDGDACTTGEHCVGGTCGGGSPTRCPTCETCEPVSGACIVGPRATPVPPATPRPGIDCRTTASHKAKLVLKDKEPNSGDLLVWKWNRWPDTSAGSFGDPTATDSYAVCVFQDLDSPAAKLVYRVDVPPGGMCEAVPCWRAVKASAEQPVGFKYVDKKGTSNGVLKLSLRAVDEKPGRIGLRAKGENLPDPTLPLTTPIGVQLQTSSGECWGSIFATSGTLKNEPTIYKARSE